MTHSDLWKYVRNENKSLVSLGIEISLRDIQEGDRYNSETGEEYELNLLDSKSLVGYSYITEDDDDWAQAECYGVSWCKKNNRHIQPIELYTLLTNYKSELREHKIEHIIKDDVRK